MKRYCTCKNKRQVIVLIRYCHRGRKRSRFAQSDKSHTICRQCFRSLSEPIRVAQNMIRLAEAELKRLERERFLRTGG